MRFLIPTSSLFVILFAFTCLTNCSSTKKLNNPYQHISDQKVIMTLKKSFKTLGGLENWQNKKTLNYNKQTTLFLESGDVERAVYQTHAYNYHPNKEISISWKAKDGKKHEIIATDDKIVKEIDGQLDQSAKTKALNTSVVTSLFVIGVPFKMLDKGAILSHEGTDVLEDGQKVEVIKAVYNPTLNKNHTTPDIWWYYFSAKDYRLVGYMVKHADHYSYVKNTEYATAAPFLLPAKRESYRVNPKREILYTRAKYSYENWQVGL
jgi:hypothetical protein